MQPSLLLSPPADPGRRAPGRARPAGPRVRPRLPSRGLRAGERPSPPSGSKARPDDVQARIVLARSEAAMGRFDAAYAGFREALRLDPRSPDALYYLGIDGRGARGGRVRAAPGAGPGLGPRPPAPRADPTRPRAGAPRRRPSSRRRSPPGPPSADVLVALGDLAAGEGALRRRRAPPTPGRSSSRPTTTTPSTASASATRTPASTRRPSSSSARALRVAPDSAPARLALGHLAAADRADGGGRDGARGGGEARAPDAPGLLSAGTGLPGARTIAGRGGGVRQGPGAARAGAQRQADARRTPT